MAYSNIKNLRCTFQQGKSDIQTLPSPADPANITFSTPQAGSASFNYQWYFQNGVIASPVGTSIAGFTTIAGATSASFDPPAGLTASRTFACIFTPAGTPTCGTAAWAIGARQITITP